MFGIWLALPGARVMYFWSLFAMMFFFASVFAFLLSSFEIIVACLFFCFRVFAMVIG